MNDNSIWRILRAVFFSVVPGWLLALSLIVYSNTLTIYSIQRLIETTNLIVLQHGKWSNVRAGDIVERLKSIEDKLGKYRK
jgi:hypothetical protein